MEQLVEHSPSAATLHSGNRTAALVIRPSGTGDLAQAVAQITAAGYAVIGRGGGTSYTGGYGPDLTALFLGDCGALGIKSRITLRLMKRPAEIRTASFNFDKRSRFSTAMPAIAREGLADTCFGMDPMLQYQRIKRASVGQGIKALKGVLASETTSGCMQ